MSKQGPLSNTAAQAAMRTLEKREREMAEQDFKSIMSTPHGRRFLYSVISGCGVFDAAFVPGQVDQSTFNEGRRSVGISLMATAQQVSIELYAQAFNEAFQAVLDRTSKQKAAETTKEE